jgi:hypothetical protein
VDQLVDETRGARFFTKVDLASAYWQFRIRQEDQFKTSFRVPGGQYEFRVGAFGLHGMSSLLMRYMHSIFGRLVFDAAGLSAPAAAAPAGSTPSMLYCVFAKASKCQFIRSSVGFLGHVISERKVAAVAEWATPTSCTDVCRFVGLANH